MCLTVPQAVLLYPTCYIYAVCLTVPHQDIFDKILNHAKLQNTSHTFSKTEAKLQDISFHRIDIQLFRHKEKHSLDLIL